MNQKDEVKNRKNYKYIDKSIIINSSIDYKKIAESINSAIPSQEMIDNMTKPLIAAVEKITAMTKPIINAMTQMQINYAPFFKGIQQALEEAKKDPDNILNWLDYSEKLSDYIWTIPYNISSEKLKEIFENVNSESEFDKYMRGYYKKGIVNNMVCEIKEMLPNKHKLVFVQIEKAYNNKMYALSIIGIMSIIDELCVFFLDDKGKGARIDMLKPIINDIEKKDGINSYLIDAMILSNNINIIYESIDFNKKIKIKTKKQARRNPCQHGRSYSNRKTDAIMLLNTIYNLLVFQKNCSKYEKSLIYNSNKKIFKIKNS